MNTFLGTNVLPDLLSIGKIYIYVDAPVIKDKSLLGAIGKRPYIYTYPAENVLSWTQGSSDDPKEFTSVILVDRTFEMDEELFVPKGFVERYRHLYLKDGKVNVQFYKPVVSGDSAASDQIRLTPVIVSVSTLEKDGSPVVLDISEIPLVPCVLTDSLLTDIADYQIALLNLSSSDMAYLIKSNTVIYTEQFDAKLEAMYKRMSDPDGKGESNEAQQAKDKTLKIGHGKGRGYPVGTDRPGFINPSSDPVKISMDKQNQLIDEIDRLIDIKLESLAITGEAKKFDKQGLEAGLSYIGLILEQTDRKIAKFYAMYEGNKEIANVSYPTDYSLRTDSDRKVEAKATADLKDKVPSKTYQKEISKQVAHILLSHKLSTEKMEKIDKEIEAANYLTSDIKSLAEAKEAGFVTVGTASVAAGFAEGEAEKAKVERAEELALIQAAQTTNNAVRGVTDPNNDQAKQDKKGKEQRGPGKEEKEIINA
jgi:hypothetical protein